MSSHRLMPYISFGRLGPHPNHGVLGPFAFFQFCALVADFRSVLRTVPILFFMIAASSYFPHSYDFYCVCVCVCTEIYNAIV